MGTKGRRGFEFGDIVRYRPLRGEKAVRAFRVVGFTSERQVRLVEVRINTEANGEETPDPYEVISNRVFVRTEHGYAGQPYLKFERGLAYRWGESSPFAVLRKRETPRNRRIGEQKCNDRKKVQEST